MIHDRVDHLQIARLRSRTIGKARVQKHAGAHRPEVDDRVTAYAPAVVEDGEVVRKREAVRCVILTVESISRVEWEVTYRAGKIDRPVFMRARPGAVRITVDPRTGEVSTDGDGDYTTSRSAAMQDEPEVLTESWDRVVGRTARAIEADPPLDRRPWKTGER